jgi:hypothetical protein
LRRRRADLYTCAHAAAMPYLILFLLIFVLGLVVSCVIT